MSPVEALGFELPHRFKVLLEVFETVSVILDIPFFQKAVELEARKPEQAARLGMRHRLHRPPSGSNVHVGASTYLERFAAASSAVLSSARAAASMPIITVPFPS